MDLNTLAVRSDTSHFLVNHRVFPIEFHTPLARYEHLRLATTRDGQWVLYWRRLSSAFAIKTTRLSFRKYLRCGVFRDCTSACSLRRISRAIFVFFTSNVTSFIVVFTSNIYAPSLCLSCRISRAIIMSFMSNFTRHHRVLHVEFHAPSLCLSCRISRAIIMSFMSNFTRHHRVLHVEFHAPSSCSSR